jgi:hypothetical protein
MRRKNMWLSINKGPKLIISLMFLNTPLLAGPVDAPAPFGDMGSAMYSINDICERLKSGAEPELTPFSGPTTGPGGGGARCTLNDVMAVAPKKATVSGAQTSEVLSGKSYWGLRTEQWGKQTGTMVNQGAQTYLPSVTDQPIAAGYHNGLGVVTGDADLLAENLKAGVDIFGVLGSYSPQVPTGEVRAEEVLEGKTFSNAQGANLTGTMPNQGAQTYLPSTQNQVIAAGYHNGQGVVSGDENLKASNIVKGVELFGITGQYESIPSASGTVVASEVLVGKTFSNNQETDLMGTMPNQGAQTYTPTTTTQPILAGYHNGQGVVSGDANLVSSNIKNSVTIFGVSGDENVVDTSSGNAVSGEIMSGKVAWVDGNEVTGSLAAQNLSDTSTTVATGVYAATTLEAIDSDLVSSNIKNGVTIFGVSGDSNVVDTSSGDALDSEILSGKKAWVAGVEVTGTGQLSTVVSPVPKTGQTISYAAGDDGNNRAGVSTTPRLDDKGDGTVVDNLTGLIWLKNANCFDQQLWADAITSANELAHGDCNLSDGSVAGNWRLPNRKELLSLVDLGQYDPPLPSGHPFLNVQSDSYWSATTNEGDTNKAWYIFLISGSVSYDNKTTFAYYVWPIRGGQ